MNVPFQGFDKEAPFAQPHRRLPHRAQTGCSYFVTWRLEDSVPKEVLERWKAERDESFDHAVRSERQLDRFRDYIRENPRKAGLKDGEFALWPP
jgi:hypothetical protein